MPPAVVLARRFAEAISALRAVHDFDEWIGQFWQERCPAHKSVGPYNPALGAEDAIVWHEGKDTVFGYLPGYDGCFCVPMDATMPDFLFGAGQVKIPFEQDIVIGASMRQQIEPPGT